MGKMKRMLTGGDESDDDSVSSEGECVSKCIQRFPEKANVEAAMVTVAERTTPYCICKRELREMAICNAYDGVSEVTCDKCSATVKGAHKMVFHCVHKSYRHRQGYDLCAACAVKQLAFDELRGLDESDEKWTLERNDKFPVRVTLQLYKATDNGVVDEQTMGDIAQQLDATQKHSVAMGSLILNTGDGKRTTDWTNAEQKDEFADIRQGLSEHCGKLWETFLENFKEEEVTDADLAKLSAKDLKALIPKMGPRNRFKKWMVGREGTQ